VNEIHKTVEIHQSALIGDNVQIGSGSVIGKDVVIKDGVSVGSNVVIQGPTIVNEECRIFPGVVLGCEPQVLSLNQETGDLVIGKRTVIREFVTVHRSMNYQNSTLIGEDCYLMNGVHVGHDCKISNRVIFASFSACGGHTSIQDDVFVSAYVGFHQFTRIGESSFIGAHSAVKKDIPPFTMIDSNPVRVRGLNVIGMKRRGISSKVRNDLKSVYKVLFNSKETLNDSCVKIENDFKLDREIKIVIDFVRSSERGIYQGTI